MLNKKNERNVLHFEFFWNIHFQQSWKKSRVILCGIFHSKTHFIWWKEMIKMFCWRSIYSCAINKWCQLIDLHTWYTNFILVCSFSIKEFMIKLAFWDFYISPFLLSDQRIIIIFITRDNWLRSRYKNTFSLIHSKIINWIFIEFVIKRNLIAIMRKKLIRIIGAATVFDVIVGFRIKSIFKRIFKIKQNFWNFLPAW